MKKQLVRLTQKHAGRDQTQQVAVGVIEVSLPLRNGLEPIEERSIITARKDLMLANCPMCRVVGGGSMQVSRHVPQIEDAKVQARAVQHVDP